MSKVLSHSRESGNQDNEQFMDPRLRGDDKHTNMTLSAKNIHKKYQQGPSALHILKGIDLDVREGDVVAIIGPSGAGKSTLLHILGGLDKPTDGEVVLNEKNVYTLNDNERSRMRNTEIGFVFQFYHLLPEFTALENVILPAMVKNGINPSGTFQARGIDLLSKVGLKDRVTHRPHELSGGEQQRVAIARALVNNPKIVFCDEPTGNLDSKSGEAIIELLLDLNKSERQTLVVVTHDEKIAKKSHKTIRIKDGKLEN